MAGARAQTLVDAAGAAHEPAGASARIVSLVPSITELLFDLGAGERVVGRTPFCIHPRRGVASVTRVGGTKTPNIERIRALEPTHVVLNVDENRREDALSLAEFVPNVVVTHPMSPGDNLDLFRLIGGIFAERDVTARLCAEFEDATARLETLARDLPKRNVVYVIWRDPWMTVSRDTYVSRMLALANFDTLGDSRDRRYPEISLDAETLSAADLVLLSTEPYPFKPKHVEEVRAFAARNAPVVALFDGEMASWYGSRAVRAMDYLASFAAGVSTLR